jgi:hypothetical protein
MKSMPERLFTMIARLVGPAPMPDFGQKKGRSEDQPDQLNWERMPERPAPYGGIGLMLQMRKLLS